MAPEMHQDGRSGVSAPRGLSDPTAPAAEAVAVLRDHRPTTSKRMPVTCMECRLPWRGTATTGGCTARFLALEVVRLEACVEREQDHIEGWIDSLNRCYAQLEAATARAALLEGLLREIASADEYEVDGYHAALWIKKAAAALAVPAAGREGG